MEPHVPQPVSAGPEAPAPELPWQLAQRDAKLDAPASESSGPAHAGMDQQKTRTDRTVTSNCFFTGNLPLVDDSAPCPEPADLFDYKAGPDVNRKNTRRTGAVRPSFGLTSGPIAVFGQMDGFRPGTNYYRIRNQALFQTWGNQPLTGESCRP